ncbi:MAG: hemolysin family protein [Phycisphaerae bacterium]|nr:hemolysin family protein [Phycisphaerae bacterium]
MTGGLLLALIVALMATSHLSALHLALLHASRSALERKLDERGQLAKRGWILNHIESAGHAIALFRTFGRVSCITIVLLLYTGVGEAAVVTAWEIVLSMITSGLLVWFFTSAISAAIARHMTHSLIASSIPFIWVARVIASPLLALVTLVDEAIRRLSGADDDDVMEADDDLLLTIEDSQREGELDPLSARILENVVEFRSTTVSSVMTPRTNVTGLTYTDDLDRIRAFLGDAGHSRIPVFEDSLDQIIGVLYVKDLIRYLGTDAPDFRLRPLLREPIRVPESKPVRELLLDFQRSEVHMAIVVDEYGGTSGLATIEDVLEEIVGEINDEHDADADEEPELVAAGPGRWQLPGRFRVDDLNAALEVGLPEDDDYDTVAGFLLKRFGRIPKVSERIDEGGWSFEVAAATRTQVMAVRLAAPADWVARSETGAQSSAEA